MTKDTLFSNRYDGHSSRNQQTDAATVRPACTTTATAAITVAPSTVDVEDDMGNMMDIATCHIIFPQQKQTSSEIHQNDTSQHPKSLLFIIFIVVCHIIVLLHHSWKKFISKSTVSPLVSYGIDLFTFFAIFKKSLL
jgi:hypothetical protein